MATSARTICAASPRTNSIPFSTSPAPEEDDSPKERTWVPTHEISFGSQASDTSFHRNSASISLHKRYNPLIEPEADSFNRLPRFGEPWGYRKWKPSQACTTPSARRFQRDLSRSREPPLKPASAKQCSKTSR